MIRRERKGSHEYGPLTDLGLTHGHHDCVGTAVQGALHHPGLRGRNPHDGRYPSRGDGPDLQVHCLVIDVPMLTVKQYPLLVYQSCSKKSTK